MPFVSKAQARYMFARHPKVAGEFADKTASMTALPEKVKSRVSVAKKKRRKSQGG